MGKMTNRGFSRGTIEEIHQHINTPRAEVREQQKLCVVFPRYKKVKVAIERHPEIIGENQTDGYLLCQNSSLKYLQSRWTDKCAGACQTTTSATPTQNATCTTCSQREK
jgi:hypothetical protein